MSKINVAIVGAGFIAGYHLQGLAPLERASVRVIASRTLDRAKALASRFGTAATTDLEGTLADPGIDAVIITTPDDTHEAIAVRALQCGKAVMLQKPMATGSDACRRIIAAAAEAGRDLQVSYMHRYFDEIDAARTLLAEGAIGDITSVRVRNATPGPDWGDWFFRRDRVAGGVVLQLGAHGIDLIEHLVGEIVSVSATTTTQFPTRRLAGGREVAVENADSAWCSYELAGNVMASHEMSMIETAGCDRFRLEIYGTEGTIWLRTERGGLAMFAPRWLGRTGWFAPLVANTPFGTRQHRRWIDGLRGEAEPEDTATAGLRGLLVAEAIDRSARQGGTRVATAATEPLS